MTNSDQQGKAAAKRLTAAEADPQVEPREVLGRRAWRSEELFGSEVEVLIAHGDQLYRLRRTRNGKLILCK